MSYRDPELEGKELSTREAKMLADHDAGMTDQELADKYGYASSNGAGNVRRQALTKVGRGSEVRAGNGGSRGPRVPKVVQTYESQLEANIEATEATIAQLSESLHGAREDANIKPADAVKHETARLEDRIARATADLEAFTVSMADKAQRDAFVAKTRETAEQRLSTLESNTQETIDKAQAQLDKMRIAMEAISGLDS